MADLIQLRGGSAAQAALNNPVLALREIGFESDTNKGKIGDGVTPYNSLPYAFTGEVFDVNGSSEKTIPQDTDKIAISDGTLKHYTLAGLRTKLKTYFDTVYGAIGAYAAANHTHTEFNTVYGFLGVPQNSKSADYTLVIGDSGKHILHPSADTTARIFTIPANASVVFPIGSAITFVNQNEAGAITIAITTDTMRLAGAGTTGSRTLAANGVATALKITSTEWIISGANLT